MRPEVSGICLSGQAGYKLCYFGTTYKFQFAGQQASNPGQFRVGPYWLTDIGAELAKVVSATPAEQYLASLLSHHRQTGWNVEIVASESSPK